jgi:hypothetical protein
MNSKQVWDVLFKTDIIRSLNRVLRWFNPVHCNSTQQISADIVQSTSSVVCTVCLQYLSYPRQVYEMRGADTTLTCHAVLQGSIPSEPKVAMLGFKQALLGVILAAVSLQFNSVHKHADLTSWPTWMWRLYQTTVAWWNSWDKSQYFNYAGLGAHDFTL